MAMSDATSNPSDWAQLFSRVAPGSRVGRPPQPFIATSVAVDSTVVTTTPAAPSQILASTGGASHSAGFIEGRVGKSARKRSRASRRAPTTLLNTDAANFRAMVQQFTGVPTGTYSSAGQSNVNFGIGFENPVGQPASLPFSRAVDLQKQQQQQYQQQYQYRQPQQQQQQEVIGFDDDLFQGMSNHSTRRLEPSSEGYFLEGMSGGQATRGPVIDNRDVGYFL